MVFRLTDQKEKELDSSDLSPSSASYLPANLSLEKEDIEICSPGNFVKYSRLSKPLVEIMRDTEAIGYFIQYLESVNVATLARCLLDVDNFNAALVSDSKEMPWSSVKGVHKVVNAYNQVTWEFSNGISYLNNVACDISSHCLNMKSGPGNTPVSARTIVRAVSETRLTEMRKLEQVMLAKIFEEEQVTEAVVDALRIFYKYFSYSAPFKILLDVQTFRTFLQNLKCDINKDSFMLVRNIIFSALESEFYNEYLRSECHCKYQMSILTGSEVLISDILYNESALFYFMEYLEQEGCRGLLEFWMAANNFQEQYVTQGFDPNQAQADAMVLYDKYFSLQASHPLHLGDKVRCLVEETICREGGPLPTCFERVQAIIINMLQTRYLSPFLQSQLYFNFLSEVISTVNAGPSLRSGGSDCSSEVSVSAMNTLLVSEDGGRSKREPHSWKSVDLNIDTRQLYDPDALWRRGRQPGLTLGRVNALGRFQTDMEPEPDRKIGLESRITKAMKKLVNLEGDKSKEEMAWQVAEMIVKDVTNLTMPSSDQ